MVIGEGGERLQALASRGHTPRRLFIEKRIRFRKEIPRRFGEPETELIKQRQGMIGAVSDKQDRLVEVRVEGGEDGQARGARQSERRCLPHVFQDSLVVRKSANVIKEKLHLREFPREPAFQL